jgi:hypothetical protein
VVLLLYLPVTSAMLSSLATRPIGVTEMSPHIYRMLVEARLAELRRRTHPHYYA